MTSEATPEQRRIIAQLKAMKQAKPVHPVVAVVCRKVALGK